MFQNFELQNVHNVSPNLDFKTWQFSTIILQNLVKKWCILMRTNNDHQSVECWYQGGNQWIQKRHDLYCFLKSENIRQKVGDELFGLFEHVTFWSLSLSSSNQLLTSNGLHHNLSLAELSRMVPLLSWCGNDWKPCGGSYVDTAFAPITRIHIK